MLRVYCTVVTSLLFDDDVDSMVVVAVVVFVTDPLLFNSFKSVKRDSTLSFSSPSNIKASFLFILSNDAILNEVATDAAVAGDNNHI